MTIFRIIRVSFLSESSSHYSDLLAGTLRNLIVVLSELVLCDETIAFVKRFSEVPGVLAHL